MNTFSAVILKPDSTYASTVMNSDIRVEKMMNDMVTPLMYDVPLMTLTSFLRTKSSLLNPLCLPFLSRIMLLDSKKYGYLVLDETRDRMKISGANELNNIVQRYLVDDKHVRELIY